MFKYVLRLPFRKACLLLLAGLLASCSSQPEKPKAGAAQVQTEKKPQDALQKPFIVIGAYQATTVTGDYANYPALNEFIEQMVQRHGFKREYLNGLFSQAKRKEWTLNYLAKTDQGLKAKPGKGSWTRYRAQFLDQHHIDSGVAFWQKHKPALQLASQQYGVPAEYILGIMAVETGFGANIGNHRIIDALTTLSFDYPRRSEFFRSELEKFLVMSATEGLDPGKPVGSFAGAMGLGQFMPSSFLQWAIDLNADGRRDLWDPEDAIGSIANYFAQHGWQKGQPVVTAVRGNVTEISSLEPGLDNPYSLSTLRQVGIEPVHDCHCDHPLRLLLLRHQNRDEYRLGYPNFYVITRYNHSTNYAMAVHELAQAIKMTYEKKAANLQDAS